MVGSAELNPHQTAKPAAGSHGALDWCSTGVPHLACPSCVPERTTNFRSDCLRRGFEVWRGDLQAKQGLTRLIYRTTLLVPLSAGAVPFSSPKAFCTTFDTCHAATNRTGHCQARKNCHHAAQLLVSKAFASQGLNLGCVPGCHCIRLRGVPGMVFKLYHHMSKKQLDMAWLTSSLKTNINVEAQPMLHFCYKIAMAIKKSHIPVPFMGFMIDDARFFLVIAWHGEGQSSSSKWIQWLERGEPSNQPVGKGHLWFEQLTLVQSFWVRKWRQLWNGGTPKPSKIRFETHGDLRIPHFRNPKMTSMDWFSGKLYGWKMMWNWCFSNLWETHSQWIGLRENLNWKS